MTQVRKQFWASGRFWMWAFVVLAMHASLVAGLCLTTGCAAVDPGGQVSRGLGQRKTYEWDENGRFSVKGDGPQTERFTMIEGDVSMDVDSNGVETVDWKKTKIRYYLKADPKADDAANAMNAALIASTAQVDRLSRSFDNLLGLIVPMVTQRGGGGTSDSGSDSSAKVQQEAALLGRLDKLLALFEAANKTPK